MTSQIASMWGKKSPNQMKIPTDQQKSMKRFLTPSRNDSMNTIDPNNSI